MTKKNVKPMERTHKVYLTKKYFGIALNRINVFCSLLLGFAVRGKAESKYESNKVSKIIRIITIGMLMNIALSGSAVGEIPTIGLIAEYHFDGDVNDSSGYGHNGINYGATFVEGKLGQALSFDGSAYVDIGNISQIDPASDWTVAFWLNSATVEDWRNSFDANFIAEGNNQGPRFEQDSDGNLSLIIGTDASNLKAAEVGHIKPGIWYHIVAIKDGDVIKIYLNNINKYSRMNAYLQSTFATNSLIPVKNLWPPGFKNVNIGRGFSTSNERWFVGFIDEVLIYNRALSSNEVKDIYEVALSDYEIKDIHGARETISFPTSFLSVFEAVFAVIGFLTIMEKIISVSKRRYKR